MKRQGGFTLIELVVVIVILGILAVTAAPKFLNLQTDARQATLEGLKGAMQGGSSIVYAKAAIDGYESVATATDRTIDGQTINVAWGYPTATVTGIQNAVTGLSDTTNWKPANIESPADNTIYYTAENVDTSAAMTGCYVSYALTPGGTDAQIPVITVVDCT